MSRRLIPIAAAVLAVPLALAALNRGPDEPDRGSAAAGPAGLSITVHSVRPAEGGGYLVECRLANPSGAAIAYTAYSVESPLYRIQFRRDGEWVEHNVGWFCGTGLGMRELLPGAEAVFSVHTVEGDPPMRIGLDVDRAGLGGRETVWSDALERGAAESARGVGPDAPAAARDLRHAGALGFPQSEAQVLCDTEDLRFSVFSDGAHLYAQAVVWADDPGAATVGDRSVLWLDVDADGSDTVDLDRAYALNPSPALPGLRYQVWRGPEGSSEFRGDSCGTGCIRYPDAGGGRRARVDSFVIPLDEIGMAPGWVLRLAYWAASSTPRFSVNSIGYSAPGVYSANSLPRDRFHEIVLEDRAAPPLDPSAVPDDRDDPVAVQANAPRPPVAPGPVPVPGSAPPEPSATDWLNVAAPPSLAGLRGSVVLVEFWATWCGPCVRQIPHLNALHDGHAGEGLVILGLTDEPRARVETFLARHPIRYAIGTGSTSRAAYGVRSIPRAFLIGRDGTLLWTGHPGDRAFDQRLVEALIAP